MINVFQLYSQFLSSKLCCAASFVGCFTLLLNLLEYDSEFILTVTTLGLFYVVVLLTKEEISLSELLIQMVSSILFYFLMCFLLPLVFFFNSEKLLTLWVLLIIIRDKVQVLLCYNCVVIAG